MSYAGKLLLFFGTVVGALGGAHLPQANWTVAGVGLVILALGAVLTRVGQLRRLGTGGQGESLQGIQSALETLPGTVEALAMEAKNLSLEELVERLTELEALHLRPISDAAPRLLGTLGGSAFAEIFGPYASGERYLARAWSAAADGHRAEATASLSAGADSLKRAARAASASSSRESPAAAR